MVMNERYYAMNKQVTSEARTGLLMHVYSSLSSKPSVRSWLVSDLACKTSWEDESAGPISASRTVSQKAKGAGDVVGDVGDEIGPPAPGTVSKMRMSYQ